jgi:hypothetical protein
MPNEEAQQQGHATQEQTAPTPEQGGDQLMERSASSVIIQSVNATGVAAGGLSALAAGVAKLKDSFGGGGESAAPPAQAPPQQTHAQPPSTDG